MTATRRSKPRASARRPDYGTAGPSWSDRRSGERAQARTRNLVSDGGLFSGLQIGNAGQTALIGVTWSDATSGPGTISGALLCQP